MDGISIITGVFIAIMSGWTVFLSLLIALFLRKDSTTGSAGNTTLSMDVIIPIRNEIKHIGTVLDTLLHQLGQPGTGLILVDDHSDDGTQELVAEFIKQHREVNIRLLALGNNKQGKKAALKAGLDASGADILCFTDADVRLPSNWMKRTLDYFTTHPGINLLCGLVSITAGGGFRGALQALDYGAMMVLGRAMLLAGRPLLASGANMAVRRAVLQEIEDPWKAQLASGDDVFLMESVYRRYGGGAIAFTRAAGSMVHSAAEKGWRAVLSQRLRWASKMGSIKNRLPVVFAIIIAVVNIVLLVSAVLAVAGSLSWSAFLLIGLLKCLPELCLAILWSRLTSQRGLWLRAPLVSLVYPFYGLTLIAAGALVDTRWKGRVISRMRA